MTGRKSQCVFIVPFAPASTRDTFARVLSDKLSTRLAKRYIVENKPGAGGMNGTDVIAKAPADIYHRREHHGPVRQQQTRCPVTPKKILRRLPMAD